MLLPILPFFRSGIFSEQKVAYMAVMACSALLFFVLWRRRAVHITLCDTLVVLYFAYGLFNIAFLQGFRVDPSLYWKWGAVGLGYAVARNITRRNMILAAVTVAGVAQSLIAIAQKLSLLRSNHGMFEVTGTFGNPGQLGGLLCVALVVALSLFLAVCRQRGKTRLLYGLSALLIAVALLLADSRAAWVGVIAGIIVWSWPAFSALFRRHKIIVLPALAVGVLAVGIALFHYKPGSVNARLLVWRVGIEMASEKPVAGYGVASFHQVYMPRQAEYFEVHPDSPWRLVADNAVYPYNEPLHLLMEQGIIGLLIMAGIFISVFAFKGTSNNFSGRNDASRTIFKAGLAAMSVYSCFSYPSYVFALRFLFPVLLGSLESRIIWRFRLPGWSSTVVKVLLALCIFQSIRLTGYYRKSEKMTDRLFSNSPQEQKQAQKYIAANWGRLRYTPVFNNVYAVWIGDNPQIADTLPPEHIAGMDPFCEGYCTLGSYYARRGEYTEAERYYLAANNMIPTRLMPNYLLWRLCVERGDTLRAVATACKALEQPLKTENDFTRWAKKEMAAFIDRIKHN